MNNLNKFIEIKRKGYSNKYNNRFAFWFNHITQYLNFSEIVYKRYEIASKNWLENNKKFINSISKKPSGPMSNEDYKLMLTNRNLQTILLLEIESYYLFVKIALDKIAYFIIDYFGNANDFKMKSSHHGLMDNIERYIKIKNIKTPDGFIKKGKFLHEHISEFRDKKISHLNNPRLIKGLTYNLKGIVNIHDSYLYPEEGEIEKQGKAKDIKELKKILNEYVDLLIQLIDKNESLSIYARDIPQHRIADSQIK